MVMRYKCLIDRRAHIMVDVEAMSASKSHEVDLSKSTIDLVGLRIGLKHQRLVGDTAYGSAALFDWMVVQKEAASTYPPSASERR
jgi:hypothetical protein